MIDNPVIHSAIKFAFRTYSLAEEDVLLCLVFGSHAKGKATSKSDVDLIFITKSVTGEVFDYRRLSAREARIDCNVMNAEALDKKCMEASWAYRLYKAAPCSEYSATDPDDIEKWCNTINKLIESRIARIGRADSQLDELSNIASRLTSLGNRSPLSRRNEGIMTFYWLLEAYALLPFVFLEIKQEIPFAYGYPVERAIAIAQSSQDHLSREYTKLISSIHSIAHDFDGYSGAKNALKRCHRLVEQAAPHLAGKNVATRLGQSDETLARVSNVLRIRGTRSLSLPRRFILNFKALLAELQSALIEEGTKQRPLTKSMAVPPLRLQGAPGSEPRFIGYDSNLQRLKGILPTGGCRVPACTFCMLPKLARSKTNVEDFLTAMERAATGPTSNVAIFTDGSFFDDREVSAEERRFIALRMASWKAKELLVESLPRFLNEECIMRFKHHLPQHCRLRIGVGIQSTDDRVRSGITNTPISDHEIRNLLTLKRAADFHLRIYLLAGKPMMTQEEDFADVLNSLRALKENLDKNDVVTINPLLPTTGTFVDKLLKLHLFAPLTQRRFTQLRNLIEKERFPFRISFGIMTRSTCTDATPTPECTDAHSTANKNIKRDLPSPLQRDYIPWTLLGDIKGRYKAVREMVGSSGE